MGCRKLSPAVPTGRKAAGLRPYGSGGAGVFSAAVAIIPRKQAGSKQHRLAAQDNMTAPWQFFFRLLQNRPHIPENSAQIAPADPAKDVDHRRHIVMGDDRDTVRILFDQGTPARLRRALTGHSVEMAYVGIAPPSLAIGRFGRGVGWGGGIGPVSA